jgi:hypothetical protein
MTQSWRAKKMLSSDPGRLQAGDYDGRLRETEIQG